MSGMHVPLNAHPQAAAPDTNPLEVTATDDEFLESLPEAHRESPRSSTADMANVLRDVAEERLSQLVKWGVQTHQPHEWMPILMEEVGEAAKEVNERGPLYHRFDAAHYRREMIQVAAVAVAAVEALDTHEKTYGAGWPE